MTFCSWWRFVAGDVLLLVTVCGWWRFVAGDGLWLVAFCGWWRFVADDVFWLVTFSGWWRFVAGDICGWWRFVAVTILWWRHFVVMTFCSGTYKVFGSIRNQPVEGERAQVADNVMRSLEYLLKLLSRWISFQVMTSPFSLKLLGNFPQASDMIQFCIHLPLERGRFMRPKGVQENN